MIFHDVAQRTPEWEAARSGLLTASRFKDIMPSPKSGKYLKAREDYKKELVAERIIGLQGKKEVFVTEEMKWGTLSEASARTQYKIRTRNRVTEEGFIQHDELLVGVSTDGLVNDEGNLEIKALAPHNHLYNIVMDNQMPDDYKDQVQSQLWISEREWADFVAYDMRQPQGLDMFVQRIYRDDKYIAFMEAEARSFLAEVDADMAEFLRYLPTAERVCQECGTIFVAKTNICPSCKSSQCAIKTVLEPPEAKLLGFEKLTLAQTAKAS